MSGNQIGSILLFILAIPLVIFGIYVIKTMKARSKMWDEIRDGINRLFKED